MIKNKIKIISIFMCIVIGMAFITGCGDKEKETIDADSKVEAQDFVLNTTCTISVYGTDDQSLADKGIEVCKEYEKMLSKTVPGSDIYKINNSGGKPVQVSDDTIKLIKKSIEYSKKTEGLFDITVGELTDTWNFTSDNPKVPEAAQIEGILPHVGYHNIKMEGNKVWITDDRAKLDLGAIAKGYIADKVAERLKKDGVKRAIINLGGNVVTIGEKQAGFPWIVGIEQPFSNRTEVAGLVESKNNSVVTSGIYERKFEENGVLYHHVLDPKTGWPRKTDLESVTIITKKSVDGDVLSTSCLLLGFEKGKKLIESTPGAEGVFMKVGGEIITTENAGFTPSDK